jgi:hypothetical protein
MVPRVLLLNTLLPLACTKHDTVRPRWSVVRLSLAIVATAIAAGCADCFYVIRGRIVQCGTTDAIEGATITVRIDEGYHPGVYGKQFTTTSKGEFAVDNDGTEACGAVQTLTFTKLGFAPLSTQVRGEAKAPALSLCMNPAP